MKKLNANSQGVDIQEVDFSHITDFIEPRQFTGRYGLLKADMIDWCMNAMAKKKQKFRIFKPQGELDKKGIEALRTAIQSGLNKRKFPWCVRYSAKRQVFVLLPKELLKGINNGKL